MAALANQGGARTCTDSAVSCTISAVIRTKNPNKTWAFVAETLSLKERAAKHRLAGSRPYTVGELQTLFQSEYGLDYLEALMADAEPRWWMWLRKVMKLAAVRRRQAEDHQEVLLLETSAPLEPGSRRRLKGIRDADRHLSAAMAEKETALGFLRPDPARAVHRPVAQAKRAHR